MFNVYDDGNDIINDIKNGWNKRAKHIRIWGFIAAALMILAGILCIVYPVQTTFTIEIIASIAFLCLGIWQVVRYFQLPAVLRGGIGLASGILNIILGVLLLTSPAQDLMATFGFMFGLNMMMLGFEQVSGSGRLHLIGISETGWLTLIGVLNIICGLILLFSPFTSLWAVSMIVAFYLLAGGITLLIACFHVKTIK